MKFAVDTKLFYGKDATDEVIKFAVEEYAPTKIGIVVDANVGASHIIDKWCSVESLLVDVNVAKIDLRSEPTYDMVAETAFDNYFEGSDLIVAIGGGSVMDIGKAIAVSSCGDLEYLISLRGMNKVHTRGIPAICYPTTAGTGAEVTHTASLIDSTTGKKYGINGRYVAPSAAVFAPELLFNSPRNVTIGSGLDALVHAYESTTSRMATMTTTMFGTAAFDIMTHSIPSSLICPSDYAIREMALLGAYYAGIAMMNAAGGIASACSYPLGTTYNIPHGFAGGILLPHEMALYGLKGYRDDFCHRFQVFQFMNSIKAPKDFGEWGFTKDDVQMMTDRVMEERGEVLKLCPVEITRDDIVKVLDAVAV